ncbi:hypothetical protein FGO68_gene8834 [Halteria grandinella]|uniref:Uncharacterized protein n=1 Tax=Halteria grandinella TaxID=5974 RepID=A0A8J8NSW7_HALGN|nr:hypothetical protein FGO68_gene8834 [Halteria grandinella]
MKPYLRQEISTLFDCLEQDKLNFKVFTEKLSSLERFGTGPQTTQNSESQDILKKTGIDQIVDRLKGERSQRENKVDMKLSAIGKGSMVEQMKAIKKKKMSDKLAKILNSQKSCADAYRINQILNLHSTEELGSAKCYQVKSPYDVQERHNTGRLSRLLYETETR